MLKMRSDAGGVQAVNWLYERVTGQNLVEALIAPLTGDFARSGRTRQRQKIGDRCAASENLNNGIANPETWERWRRGVRKWPGLLWTVARGDGVGGRDQQRLPESG